MKLIFLALFTAILQNLTSAKDIDCGLILVNHKFYDLCHIGSPSIVVEDIKITFNFSSPTISNCNKTKHISGIANDELNNCYDFVNIENKPVPARDDVIIDGVQVSSTATLEETNQTIEFLTNIYCDKTSQGSHFTIKNRTVTRNENKITVTVSSDSSYGCTVTPSNKVIDFLIDNKAFFAPILVLIGIIYCFLGLRHFNAVISLTLIGTTFAIIGLILEESTTFSGSQLMVLIVLGSLFIADIILTYLLKKTKTMGFMVVGTAFGAVNGVLIYDTMLSPILRSYAGDAIFYIVVSVCSLSAAVIAAWIQKDGFIIFTAFIGSFLIVRPISVIIGGFPSEIAVSSGSQQFVTTTYYYLVAILIIASLGIRYQKKYYNYILRAEKVKDERISFSEYMQLF